MTQVIKQALMAETGHKNRSKNRRSFTPERGEEAKALLKPSSCHCNGPSGPVLGRGRNCDSSRATSPEISRPLQEKRGSPKSFTCPWFLKDVLMHDAHLDTGAEITVMSANHVQAANHANIELRCQCCSPEIKPYFNPLSPHGF